jgi:hypothetical protein
MVVTGGVGMHHEGGIGRRQVLQPPCQHCPRFTMARNSMSWRRIYV